TGGGRMKDGAPQFGPGREFDLIRRILRPAAGGRDHGGPGGDASRADVEVGPGDDCVEVRSGGIALSVDDSVEDGKLRRDWRTLEEVGYPATMAGLSDLAAVAARPLRVLTSLAATGDRGPEGIERLMAAVRRAVGTVGGAVL